MDASWRIRAVRRVFIPPGGGGIRRTYAWMFLSGSLYAGSTFLMLMVITQSLGVYAGGVFSIALATSQQLLTIGYFSVRTYQVSDVREEFSFGDYLSSRILTVGLMLAAGALWMVFGGFSRDKTQAVLLLLLLKAAEAFADVLEGRYQQKNRLDAACRGVFAKTLLSLLGFLLAVLLGRHLLLALGIMVLVYSLGLIAIDGALIGHFARASIRFDWRSQRALLGACFPMFLSAFLLMFVNNAPKYALNAFQDEESMAHYSALFMVSFVISLLSMFLLKPLVASFSLAYLERDKTRFLSLLRTQLRWVAGLSAACIGVAYLAGIPVLSAMFGLDLSPYRTELCLLMTGGALMAFAQVFQCVLVVMRRQTGCLLSIAVTAAVALQITPRLVQAHAITGAAWSYCVSMAALAVVGMLLVWFFLRGGD